MKEESKKQKKDRDRVGMEKIDLKSLIAWTSSYTNDICAAMLIDWKVVKMPLDFFN